MKNIFRTIPFLAALMLGAAGCQEKEVPVIPQTPVYPEREANTMVIYEANPRLFAETGCLDAVAGRLDQIQELGVNVLWLMPIHPVGEDSKSIGSPYCVKDFRAVNPTYGTVTDLKELVSSAHSKGMKVIIDWVANHTSWDNAWAAEHPEWYVRNEAGEIQSPEAWGDVAELNFEDSTMCDAMISAMKYWIEETDIDGYRFDHVDGVPSEFWSEALAQVRGVKEGLLMLAETSDPYYLTSGFDMLYGWDFKDKLSYMFNGKAKLSDLYASHTTEFAGLAPNQGRMRYSTNHDQASSNSPIAEYRGEAGSLAAFVIATYMGGTPLIYSSQEVGYTEKLPFTPTTVTIDWNSNPEYTAKMKAVMKAYKDTETLRAGSPALYQKGSVVAFSYAAGLLVMVNTSSSEVSVKMPLDHVGAAATDVISGKAETLETVRTFAPYEYKLWKTVE